MGKIGKKRWLGLIAILLLGLAAGGIWQGGRASRQMAVDRELFYAELRRLESDGAAADARAWAAFQQDLTAAGRILDRAEAMIPETVERQTAWSNCWRWAVAFALDRMRGTRAEAAALARALEQGTPAECIAGRAAAQAALERLTRQLRAAELHTRTALLSAAAGKAVAGGPLPEQQTLVELTAVAATMHQQAGATSLATAGAALEAAFLRSSLGAFRRALMPLSIRLAASWSGGALAALADGPLPVGDVVGATLAAGGMAWTAYDLDVARRRLPLELARDLTRLVAASRAEALTAALREGAAHLERSRRQRQILLETAKEQWNQ